MGFELHRIVSDECHYGQYECIICQSLVDLDCLVTTACSHVFCRLCLLSWIDQQDDMPSTTSMLLSESSRIPKCPTCNQNLLFSSSSDQRHYQTTNKMVQNTPASMMVGGRALLVQPLEVCQPLAHRVLKRIQVSCPLHHVSSCSWKGDYGDLQNHLLSPSAHNTSTQHEDRDEAMQTNPVVSIPSENPQEEPPDIKGKQTQPHEQHMDVDNIEQNQQSQHGEPPRSRRTESLSTPLQAIAIASSLKEEANAKFATQHYQEAHDLYSKALAVLGNDSVAPEQNNSEVVQLRATLYSSRAACRHGVNDFAAAVQDATFALCLYPNYAKAYIRKAKALVQMADFTGAIQTLVNGLSHCNATASSSLLNKEHRRVTTLQSQHKKSLELLAQKQYAAAKAELGNLLRETTAPSILLEAAQADLGMGVVDSARRLCLQAVRRQSCDESLAYLVQGQCNILSHAQKDDMQLLDSGVALLKRAIRLDPDSQSIATLARQWLKVFSLLNQARTAFFERKFDNALYMYSTCLETAPLLPPKAPLYSAFRTERAEVLLRLKKYDSALQDVSLVLYYREDHVAAWMVRFAALHGDGDHDTVLEETMELLRTWGQNDQRIRRAYEKADFETRKAKRPDYYKMLGVSPIASEREIKKAFRVVAKDMHPDRFASSPEEERLKAQQEFQHLSHGLEILTDDFQRKLYDEGYDEEAIKERIQAAERAAHQSNYHGHRPHGYYGGH